MREGVSVASWFDKVRFKLQGAQKWFWADATVYEYTLGEPRGRSNLRRAELSYSFWIEGHIYSETAVWNELDTDPNLYPKNDVIQIQYNSSDPTSPISLKKKKLVLCSTSLSLERQSQ
jgi:hypothetical protein